MEIIFINTKNNKTNELHTFVLALFQQLYLIISKNMLHFKTYLFIRGRKIYYSAEAKPLKTKPPIWNNEF